MSDSGTWPLFLSLPAGLGGGVLLGLIYFRAVRTTADLIVTGRRRILAVALVLGRLALLCAGLFLALQGGALVLLATLAGILVGRTLMIRRARIDAE